MNKTIIIGSTTTDLLIHVPTLPKSTEDINIISQEMKLGGCAYNISHMYHLFKVPYILCTPQGTGPFGEFVKNELSKRNITLPIKIDKEAGVCICSIEQNGERSFMAHHGVEYEFNREWIKDIDMTNTDSVYICGLEIEEPSGLEIIEYLEENKHLQVFFAPGPRILHIQKDRMDRIYNLSCVLHVNEKELLTYTKLDSLEQACTYLSNRTNNDVIVTLGEKGSYLFSNSTGKHFKSYPTTVKDAVGAGDSHLGTYMSCIKLGFNKNTSMDFANYIASKVLTISGSSLSEEHFVQIHDEFLSANQQASK